MCHPHSQKSVIAVWSFRCRQANHFFRSTVPNSSRKQLLHRPLASRGGEAQDGLKYAAAGSPFSGDIDLGYNESTDVDEFVNDRIQSERTNLSINGAYRARQRFSVRGNLRYNDRNSVGYSNLREESGSAGVVFHEHRMLTSQYQRQRAIICPACLR